MEGEETIMEEENENLEESVELERNKALRKLAGGDNEDVKSSGPQPLTVAAVAAVDALSAEGAQAPSSPGELQRRPSNDHSHQRSHSHGNQPRGTSMSSSHGSTLFTAHRVVNPFGTPNGTHFTSHSHRTSKRESDKPKLRDIFKSTAVEGEDGWVDEDEGLYSGGFGQASSRPALPTHSSSGTPTMTRTGMYPVKAGEEFGTPNLPMLGEGRYAGVSRTECAAPVFTGSRPRGTAKGPSFKQAATVVEEEEEEEA